MEANAKFYPASLNEGRFPYFLSAFGHKSINNVINSTE